MEYISAHRCHHNTGRQTSCSGEAAVTFSEQRLLKNLHANVSVVRASWLLNVQSSSVI